MKVIIIGAGAAGLMAGKILAENNMEVTLLEARDRIGGRVLNVEKLAGNQPAEGGAEFIHGDLPVTLKLLQEAGQKKQTVGGEFLTYKKGKWNAAEDFEAYGKALGAALKSLQHDISVKQFLTTYFGEESKKEMRESVVDYVEGYHAADANNASAQAFLKDYLQEDADQYRPVEGYTAMLVYMQKRIVENGGNIMLSNCVSQIDWEPGSVVIHTTTGEIFKGDKVVITLPLGIWQSNKIAEGAIEYNPQIEEYRNAALQMGNGSAIKILMWFTGMFWEDAAIMETAGQNFSEAGFIISDQPIPTWWTQLPGHKPLLTGWIAGTKALALSGLNDESILQLATNSLATIFKLTQAFVSEHLLDAKVYNWCATPFALGAYSYKKVGDAAPLALMMEPIQETIYIAGEAFNDGESIGTVEAALESGQNVAHKILTMEQ